MKYFRKMQGERLYLSPVSMEDASVYAQWMNDPAVAENLGNYAQLTSLRGEERILEELVSQGQNYAIVLQDGDRMIGNISLMEIDHISRKATLGLFIGEDEHRGKGYGTEAIRLMAEYGFRTLNLHNIMLLVHEDNERGIACYTKAGFREFGRRTEAKFKDGRYMDVVYMELLDTGFYARPQ